MKNLLTYHLAANGSVVLFLYPWLEGWISTGLFVVFGLLHGLVIHPILDYHRLLALGKIQKGDLRKMWKWAGLYRFKYYSALTFGV